MTLADLALAKERLAGVEAMPEDATARMAIIRHWKAEVRAISTQIASERASLIVNKRYNRAKRRQA